jgi:pantetheine-phosphate adenylyltransferase
MKKFKKVAVGGTFDKLHMGHEALLDKAIEVGEQVLIGLSSDEFVSRMGKPHQTASYEERLKILKDFLDENGVEANAEIVQLNDSYGITLTDKNIDALVVSKETEAIAKKINSKRKEVGLKPLKILTIHMVPAENRKPISTTRIRKGEIDRCGHMLKKE